MRFDLQLVKKPFFQAVAVFLLLLVLLTAFLLHTDLSEAGLKTGLIFVSIVAAFYIAVHIYKGAEKEVVQHIEYEFAKDVTPISQELYTKLYENSPVPYLLIDEKGLVVSANTAAARMYGQRTDTMRSLNAFSRLHSEASGHLELLIEKYQSGVSIYDETVQLQRPDGSASWVLLSLFRFTTRASENMGLLTLVDITKQKRIEEAKSNFVSLASHQLRTPIAGIKWSAELLQMDAENKMSPQQKKYLERLLSSTKRMALLIDDFLRVSRFELGTFQPEYAAIDIHELLEDVMSELTPRVNQKRIIVKTFFDVTLPKITTDQHLLRMILSNIYSNAVKYTKSEGTIHVGYARRNKCLVISVADNGMGIPAIEQGQIFSKLYRASNAARNEPDGTGLGLYIVKEAVGVLGGKISFTSTENLGTTFELELPLDSVS